MSGKKPSHGPTEGLIAVCSSDALATGGLGIRFEVTDEINTWPAFVIRHSRGLAAYINRCAHLALELDWDHGLFFDLEQRHLICAVHGALYAADTGKCIGGPCNGWGLEVLQIVETGGTVYLRDPHYSLRASETKTQK